MKELLYILFCGIVWMWRGSKYTFGNYITAIVTSSLIILPYYIMTGYLINGYILYPILALAILEAGLGYGEITFGLNKWVISNPPLAKEAFIMLGFLSVCYSLIPYLLFRAPYMYARTGKILLVFLVGSIGFPLAKYVDIYLQTNCLAFITKYHIDSWKVAEFLIGMFIGYSWIVGR